jgi:hypothetical protein
MPVELPVAPIPSEDPKQKKEKEGDENKPGSKSAPGKSTDGKPDEEELVSETLHLMDIRKV